MTTQTQARKALEGYRDGQGVGFTVATDAQGRQWYIPRRASGSQWVDLGDGFLLVSDGYQQPARIRGSGVPLKPPGWGPVSEHGLQTTPEFYDCGADGIAVLEWVWPAEVVAERYLAASSETVEDNKGRPRPVEGSYGAKLAEERLAANLAIIEAEAAAAEA